MSNGLDQLKTRAAQWRVTIDETLETSGSLFGFGVRDGSAVVLKITKRHGDESHSGEVLRAFDGDGTVRVYESDTGAVLLELLDPGDQLVTLTNRGDDEKATRILAQVIAKMANHQPPAGCPTVTDWGLAFDRYLNSKDGQLPIELVHEACDLYQSLAASQQTTMLLHGDLQHYNVLFDAKRGWLAIDPKGVVGELEYEIGPILRNPVEDPHFFATPDIVDRRLTALVDELDLDYERTLSWSFAQSVLSAIWDVEDGYPVKQNNPALMLAHSLKQILGG